MSFGEEVISLSLISGKRRNAENGRFPLQFLLIIKMQVVPGSEEGPRKNALKKYKEKMP